MVMYSRIGINSINNTMNTIINILIIMMRNYIVKFEERRIWDSKNKKSQIVTKYLRPNKKHLKKQSGNFEPRSLKDSTS